MVDAIAVVQVAAAPRALAKPAEIVVRDHVPPIDRHAPVLTGVAEGVRRHAEGDVEMKLILAGPDIRAVAVDHERQVAEERDAARRRAGRHPLRVRDPLDVLAGGHLACQHVARVSERCLIAPAKRFGPLGPWALALARMDRPEDGVLVDPPCLLGKEPREGPRAIGIAANLCVDELLEGAAKRPLLQPPNRRVLHRRRPPHALQLNRIVF